MESLLENELACIKHCWGAYEQNMIMNSVRVDDRTAECETIASIKIGLIFVTTGTEL